MRPVQLSRRALQSALWKAMAALFIIPLLLWGFTLHVLTSTDEAFFAQLDPVLAQQQTPADAARISAQFRANPPSSICARNAPEFDDYRQDVCAPWSDHWQIFWAHRIATMLLAGGVLLLALVAGLGWLAFRDRRWQYRSLVLGWRVLATSSALVVVTQSIILTWLSYVVTVFYFEKYYPKLIILMGIGAAVAAFSAVAKMFQRTRLGNEIEGELLSEAHAPALWNRVRVLAEQLGTAPPDQIVAGIDDNFFVTESPLSVQEHVLGGRTLFVSLPLLRVLGQREADAILAHELAHLKGGDTESGALLGPKLAQFDRFLYEMGSGNLTLIAYALLSLYRLAFELAIKEDSRRVEFKADRAAARAVSATAMMRALVKVIAYGSYRGEVERELFERDSRHGEALGIANYVAQGLRPFIQSGQLHAMIDTATMPHPFDSHPTLEERLRNVGCTADDEAITAILMRDVPDSWINDIATAETVEARLWAAYEGRFVQSHELNLSWRATLDDADMRAMVESHFPPVRFALRGKKSLTVSVDGLTLPVSGQFLAWEGIDHMEYVAGFGADILKLRTPEKAFFGNKTVKVMLPGVKKQRESVQQTLGAYWQRSRMARGLA